MTSKTLQIIIKAKDQTGGAISGITGNLQSIGKVAIGGAVAGLATLGVGMATVGRQAIGLGADANETASLLESSLGPATEGLNNALSDFADNAGRSFFELQSGASTFVAMTKAMGLSESAAAAFSEEMTVAAVDLGSFFNVSDSQALDDLQSALAGSSETMQKYGIDVRETTLKQMALDQGLIENASDVIPRQIRAQLLLQAVQEQASDAMGDAVRTSDSWQNSLRGLRGRLTDTVTEIGQKLIPALTPLLNLVSDLANRALPYVIAGLDAAIPIITGVTTEIGAFFGYMQEGVPFVENMAGAIYQLGVDTFGLTHQKAISLVEGFKSLWGTIQGIIAPIAAFISENVKLQDVLIVLGGAIAAVIIPALASIIAAAAPVIAVFALAVGVVALLRQAWETDFAGIRDFVANIWLSIQIAWEAFRALFEGDWDRFLTLIDIAWRNAWDALVAFLGNIWAMVKPKLTGLWTSIQTWFNGIDWGSLGRSIVDGIKAGLSNAAPALISSIGGLASDAWNTFKSKLGISSPSKAFAMLGESMGQGLVVGLQAQKQNVAMASAGMAGAAMAGATNSRTVNIMSGAIRIENRVDNSRAVTARMMEEVGGLN